MEQDEMLSEKEINILYKKTRQECVQSALDKIGRVNRLEAGTQMVEVFAEYLRQTGEGIRRR